MRATIQRVTQASVSINGLLKGKIGSGAVVFLGIKKDDTRQDVKLLVDKIVHSRFCQDGERKTNLSLLDTKGAVLIISQFTLYADTSGGRRPSFSFAAKPETAIPLYETFIEEMKKTGLTVQTGEFGAYMHVVLTNDGPFTLNLDTTDM